MKEAAERVVSRQNVTVPSSSNIWCCKDHSVSICDENESAYDIRSVPFPKAGARKSNSSGCQEQERPEYWLTHLSKQNGKQQKTDSWQRDKKDIEMCTIKGKARLYCSWQGRCRTQCRWQNQAVLLTGTGLKAHEQSGTTTSTTVSATGRLVNAGAYKLGQLSL